MTYDVMAVAGHFSTEFLRTCAPCRAGREDKIEQSALAFGLGPRMPLWSRS